METTAKKLAQLVNEKRSDWLMEKLFLNLETFQDLKNEDKRELLEKAIFYQIDMMICSLFANEPVKLIVTIPMLQELIQKNTSVFTTREVLASFDCLNSILLQKTPSSSQNQLTEMIIEFIDSPLALLFFGFSVLRIIERFILNDEVNSSYDKEFQDSLRHLAFQMISNSRACFTRAQSLLTTHPLSSTLSPLPLWGLGLCTFFHAKNVEQSQVLVENPQTKNQVRDLMYKRSNENLIDAMEKRNISSASSSSNFFTFFSSSLWSERDFLAFFMSPYYLAWNSVLCHSLKKCEEWLRLAKKNKQLPSTEEILRNVDFSTVQQTQWFQELLSLVNSQNSNSTGHNQPIPIDSIISIPPPPKIPPAFHSLESTLRGGLMKSTLNFLSETILIVNRDNLLASSISSDHKRVNSDKQRLKERMELYNLKERRTIPGDGNCQMYSLSDQLYGTLDKARFVREVIVEWLRKNENLILPNGAKLKEFVNDKSYSAYCDEMAKEGTWGDHLTLIAAAEVFGARIFILSSVVGNEYTVEITPLNPKWPNTLLLSHYAEFHYGSLAYKDPIGPSNSQ